MKPEIYYLSKVCGDVGTFALPFAEYMGGDWWHCATDEVSFLAIKTYKRRLVEVESATLANMYDRARMAPCRFITRRKVFTPCERPFDNVSLRWGEGGAWQGDGKSRPYSLINLPGRGAVYNFARIFDLLEIAGGRENVTVIPVDRGPIFFRGHCDHGQFFAGLMCCREDSAKRASTLENDAKALKLGVVPHGF